MIGWRTPALVLLPLLFLFACTVQSSSGPTDTQVTASAPAISAASAPSIVPTSPGAADGASAARATASPIPSLDVPTAPPASPASPTPPANHAITTVFLIVMENHNWSAIYQRPSAPYINNILLPMGAHAEHYDNPPGIHPSLPNYLWLEAGTNFSIRAKFCRRRSLVRRRK